MHRSSTQTESPEVIRLRQQVQQAEIKERQKLLREFLASIKSIVKEQAKLHLPQSLDELKRSVITRPQVFLSYAWEPANTPRLTYLHYFLKYLADDFEAAGLIPWFDLQRMTGDLEKQMRVGIQKSQYVLLVGTHRYAERTKPGSDTNVHKELKFALEEYKKRIESDDESADFLMPLMLEGDYGTTFPTVGQYLIHDGRSWYSLEKGQWQSFENYIQQLTQYEPLGILPCLLGLNRRERQLFKYRQACLKYYKQQQDALMDKLKLLARPHETSDNKSLRPTRLITVPQIPLHELDYDRKNDKVGSGSYGEVYRGYWQEKWVAVKELTGTLTVEAEKELYQEAGIMAHLSQVTKEPYPTVQLFGLVVEKEKSTYALVMEYMSYGTLFELLQRWPKLPEDLMYQIALDVAYGLDLLHRQSILHRDLRSHNVLLRIYAGRVRGTLSDFGLSTVKNSVRTTTTKRKENQGTLAWMAPELLKRGGKSSPESDIYSYGMLLWELVTHGIPFADSAGNPDLIRQWVLLDREREKIPTHCPDVFAKIIQHCWEEKPDNRITLTEIQQELTALSKMRSSSVETQFILEELQKTQTGQEEKWNARLEAKKSLAKQKQEDEEGRRLELEKLRIAERNQQTEIKAMKDKIAKLEKNKNIDIEEKESLQTEHIKDEKRYSINSEVSISAPKILPINEQFKLQDQLITACKQGDKKSVEATIQWGAKASMPNAKGEYPLAAAVWGMCPDIVSLILKQVGDASPMTWDECENHNMNHYQTIFMIPKFEPTSFNEWHILLQKMDANLFIRSSHLIEADEQWRDADSSSWESLKNFVKSRTGMIGSMIVSGWNLLVNPDTIARHGRVWENTENEFASFRAQIQEKIRAASIRQANSQSVGTNEIRTNSNLSTSLPLSASTDSKIQPNKSHENKYSSNGTTSTATAEEQKVKSSISLTTPSDVVIVKGNGSCAFYCFAIGLMEAIATGTLILDTAQHASFLRIFGHNILNPAKDSTPEQVKNWVIMHYNQRYEFKTYEQLNPILRMLTSTLVKKYWNQLVDQMLKDLVGMVHQARDEKTSRFDMPSFEQIFQSSYLREGEFGKALQRQINAVSEPIGSNLWQKNIKAWLSQASTRVLYNDSVVKALWASKNIELPLLGAYFDITIYVDDIPIHTGHLSAEIGMVMPRGMHYDFKKSAASKRIISSLSSSTTSRASSSSNAIALPEQLLIDTTNDAKQQLEAKKQEKKNELQKLLTKEMEKSERRQEFIELPISGQTSAPKPMPPISQVISPATMPTSRSKISAEQLQLQNQLIAACKKGDEMAVKALLQKRARPELSNATGEQPLGAAVWGMCPGVVKTLLQQAEGIASMTWKECEEHNLKRYKEVFIVPQFNPQTVEEWYQLLLKINSNSFVRAFHFKQAKKQLGVTDWDNYVSWYGERVKRQAAVLPLLSKEKTEDGYIGFRMQIKQEIESAKHSIEEIKALQQRPQNELKLQTYAQTSIPKPMLPISQVVSQTIMPTPKPKTSDIQLQDKLILACKQGDEKVVMTLLRQGAKPDMANTKGEQPLGAAIWGMCPNIVNALLEAASDITPMTWKECEKHNLEKYGSIFIITKFYPLTFGDYYKLFLNIKENSFVKQIYLNDNSKLWEFEGPWIQAYIYASLDGRGVSFHGTTQAWQDPLKDKRLCEMPFYTHQVVKKAAEFEQFQLKIKERVISTEKLKKGHFQTIPASQNSHILMPITENLHAPLKLNNEQQLELQDKLVIACEQGDIKAVSAFLAQGAKPNLANRAGKQPLGAAVWGMNFRIVKCLLEESSQAMSWSECKNHNLKHYKEIFLISDRPYSISQWYQIIQKINCSPFLQEIYFPHFKDTLNGWGGINTSSYIGWTEYVGRLSKAQSRPGDDSVKKYFDHHKLMIEEAHQKLNTYKEQIEQLVEKPTSSFQFGFPS